MGNKNKKEWRQPKLIVIGQGRPEENVLTGCKFRDSTTTVLPQVARSNCNVLEGSCAACSSNGKTIS